MTQSDAPGGEGQEAQGQASQGQGVPGLEVQRQGGQGLEVQSPAFEILNPENEEAIEELAWTLAASRGEFSLLIVRCNYGQLRDRAIAALQERVLNVVVWRVPMEAMTLLEGIQRAAEAEASVAAVMVTGVEGVRQLDEVLSSANRIREEFRSRCPYPVVLWVTDVGLRSLMRSAPDFESWGTVTRLDCSEVEAIAQEERTIGPRSSQDKQLGSLDTYSASFVE